MLIKTADEIEILRECGRRLARVLYRVAEDVAPGARASDLDRLAWEEITKGGDKPAFLNYRPVGAARSFPSTLCVSVNDEIVHGIPTDRELKEGDIVGLDLGIQHRGLFTDMAITVPVGKVDNSAKELIRVTREALEKGISAINPDGYTGDIGEAVESFVAPSGFSIVEVLGGHGVGHAIHEEPFIANFGKGGTGEKLRPGMVLAIEPMLNEGTAQVKLGADKFTFKTRDGKRSAHFEHTILVTDKGAEILTKK